MRLARIPALSTIDTVPSERTIFGLRLAQRWTATEALAGGECVGSSQRGALRRGVEGAGIHRCSAEAILPVATWVLSVALPLATSACASPGMDDSSTSAKRVPETVEHCDLLETRAARFWQTQAPNWIWQVQASQPLSDTVRNAFITALGSEGWPFFVPVDHRATAEMETTLRGQPGTPNAELRAVFRLRQPAGDESNLAILTVPDPRVSNRYRSESQVAAFAGTMQRVRCDWHMIAEPNEATPSSR